MVLIEDIDEAVPVRADFKGGEVSPLVFRRSGRDYKVEAVNSRWIDREGTHPRLYFSVEAQGDTYLLSLATENMTWRIEKVMLEG